jgi:phosphatidylinositol alpha-1,6-mannosyltransferase
MPTLFEHDALPAGARLGEFEIQKILGVGGFGIVYLEAALAGKPVIASRGGGVADAVLDNETGLLVDPEAQSIRSAINKLLNYPSLAQRLGDRGRQRAQTDFNWASQAQKIINLLQD